MSLAMFIKSLHQILVCIGEILRRLVGKVVVGNIRKDIISAAGPLQTCAGLKAGIEASIHAMREIYEKMRRQKLFCWSTQKTLSTT